MDPLFASPTFGNPGGKREFISYEARAVLVEHVLVRATALETQAALRKIGVSRSVTGVMLWMRQIRRWLGLPLLYPSILSVSYKEAVDAWIAENGFPSREEIISGWLPRGEKPQPPRHHESTP